MIAFVLGGGGNLGALQAGAVRALSERGIRPGLLVGTSVGAINAAYLAEASPDEGVVSLAAIWAAVRAGDIYPGGWPRALWRLARGAESLYPSGRLRAFLTRHLPRPAARFRDLPIPLAITATDLRSGRVHVFGADTEDSVLEAVLASVALPPYLPPVRHGDALLVDGSVAAHLPIGVAVEQGATEIYALDVRDGALPESGHADLRAITYRSLVHLLQQQADRDCARWAGLPGVRLHRLVLQAPRPLAFDDFRHGAELVAVGREAAERQLAKATVGLVEEGVR